MQTLRYIHVKTLFYGLNASEELLETLILVISSKG